MRIQPDEQEELARIQAAVRGEGAAREWLVDRFTPMVYRYALRVLHNEQDARDAAQDTMVKVLRNLHRYQDRWKFSTWVLSITRNTCIDEFRKRRRRSSSEVPDIADTRPSPLDITEQQRRSDRLHTALESIPPLYRDVLVLYHFEHLKYQEIADVLDIPIGTVMNRIFRARRKLRDAYEAQVATAESDHDQGEDDGSIAESNGHRGGHA